MVLRAINGEKNKKTVQFYYFNTFRLFPINEVFVSFFGAPDSTKVSNDILLLRILCFS